MECLLDCVRQTIHHQQQLWESLVDHLDLLAAVMAESQPMQHRFFVLPLLVRMTSLSWFAESDAFAMLMAWTTHLVACPVRMGDLVVLQRMHSVLSL